MGLLQLLVQQLLEHPIEKKLKVQQLKQPMAKFSHGMAKRLLQAVFEPEKQQHELYHADVWRDPSCIFSWLLALVLERVVGGGREALDVHGENEHHQAFLT